MLPAPGCQSINNLKLANHKSTNFLPENQLFSQFLITYYHLFKIPEYVSAAPINEMSFSRDTIAI